MHLSLALVVSALLFGIGMYGVLARRNTIALLMAVELMLNAANIDLVAFDVWFRDKIHAGQSFALFVIVIAAAEVGVGFAIVLSVFRLRETISIDALDDLADRDPVVPVESARADA
jgi:NADH-quinone oxidoreductase subunit K